MKTFTDKAEVTSKCHLDDVDIQINENRITEYNEEGVTVSKYVKSKDLIIVGTSDGKRIKFTIKGDFNTILETKLVIRGCLNGCNYSYTYAFG